MPKLSQLQICSLSDVSLKPIRIRSRGAHDEFSFSYICFSQFIGSKKFLAIKHQTKVSIAFACGNVAPAIHLITRWPLLCLSSLSDFSRCLTVTVFPGYLHEIVGKKHRASAFRISDKICVVRPILSARWAMYPYKLRWTLVTCQLTILVQSVSFSFSLLRYHGS